MFPGEGDLACMVRTYVFPERVMVSPEEVAVSPEGVDVCAEAADACPAGLESRLLVPVEAAAEFEAWPEPSVCAVGTLM